MVALHFPLIVSWEKLEATHFFLHFLVYVCVAGSSVFFHFLQVGNNNMDDGYNMFFLFLEGLCCVSPLYTLHLQLEAKATLNSSSTSLIFIFSSNDGTDKFHTLAGPPPARQIYFHIHPHTPAAAAGAFRGGVITFETCRPSKSFPVRQKEMPIKIDFSFFCFKLMGYICE